MISPALFNHHRRVSTIAHWIAREAGLSPEETRDVRLAGLIHDIGALNLSERLELLRFEDRFDLLNPNLHGEIGYRLFREFEPLSAAASFVRYHHSWWNGDGRQSVNGKSLPAATHILHLADRVDVLSVRKEPFDSRISGIIDNIRAQRGKMFAPDAVDAFVSVAGKEAFWFDIDVGDMLSGEEECHCIELDADRLLEVAGLICHIIDFRSRFTSTHSSGVAAVAQALAARFGFSRSDCAMISVAGFLHDLGKLAIPLEILDKPGALTGSEFGIMKKHPYLTFRALNTIEDLREVNEWASFHHERIDGNGYPFHVKGGALSLGSRIVAAADVFVALTEDRPYREALDPGDALKALERMTAESALDPGVVSVISGDIDGINGLKERARAAEEEKYESFERESAESHMN